MPTSHKCRKCSGVNTTPPPNPHPPLSSSVLSAAFMSTEWVQRIIASPACGNFAWPRSFLGSLCEHMRAERARCLGMIWLYRPCG